MKSSRSAKNFSLRMVFWLCDNHHFSVSRLLLSHVPAQIYWRTQRKTFLVVVLIFSSSSSSSSSSVIDECSTISLSQLIFFSSPLRSPLSHFWVWQQFADCHFWQRQWPWPCPWLWYWLSPASQSIDAFKWSPKTQHFEAQFCTLAMFSRGVRCWNGSRYESFCGVGILAALRP